MKRDEINVLRRESFLALKGFFAMSLDLETCELLDLAQMAAARSMHEASCRELTFQPAPALPISARDTLALAVVELDKALNDLLMRNEHVLIAIRHILQVLRPAGDDHDAGSDAAKEGSPP